MTSHQTEMTIETLFAILPPSLHESAADLAMRGRLAIEPASRWNPIGVREYFGTDADPDDRRARLTIESGARRTGRCYELSLAALLRAPSNALLVHGSMHGPDEDNIRIGHGWVEIGDVLWEPARALLYDKEQWYELARARPERMYSKHAAAKISLQTGHYGRWHESRYP